MHSENWDDLRYVLSVADHGSVSAAARSLGVNHATVLRRVAAFEERFGSPVFVKTQKGYAVAPNRMDVITAMREVDEAVHSVRRAIAGTRAPLSGVVRVTSTDTICIRVLAPIVMELRHVSKELRIELISSNAGLDLSRLAADITVRPTDTLPESIAGISAGRLGFGAYAQNDSVKAWLGMTGDIARAGPAKWMAQEVPKEGISGSADSFMTLQQMAVAGIWRAALPCFIGDADPRLNRLHGVMPDLAVPLWVGCHHDFVDVPRIRAVRDRLADAILRQKDRLVGR